MSGELAPRPIHVKGRLFCSTREALEAYRIVVNAFRTQLMGGFSFVEFLGSCNMNWRMGIDESKAFVHEVSTKIFPAGALQGPLWPRGEGLGSWPPAGEASGVVELGSFVATAPCWRASARPWSRPMAPRRG
ncbi:MAG: hypothetical protein ACP5G6_08090 [Conexivisphaera sp.]